MEKTLMQHAEELRAEVLHNGGRMSERDISGWINGRGMGAVMRSAQVIQAAGLGMTLGTGMYVIVLPLQRPSAELHAERLAAAVDFLLARLAKGPVRARELSFPHQRFAPATFGDALIAAGAAQVQTGDPNEDYYTLRRVQA